MDELIAFLNARLDEDELAARAATCEPWAVAERFGSLEIHTAAVHQRYVGDKTPEAWGVVTSGDRHEAVDRADADHIARHDPARVLADVAAKRAIVDWHTTPHAVVNGFCVEEGGDCTGTGQAECKVCGQTPCDTVRLLGQIYADHADYREEWRP